MKTMLSSTSLLLMALCLISVSEAIQVHEGGYIFSMESVMELQDLAESTSLREKYNPHLASSIVSVCESPDLPKEFLPLCMQRGGVFSLSRLAMMPMDLCEICAYVACTGCRYHSRDHPTGNEAIPMPRILE